MNRYRTDSAADKKAEPHVYATVAQAMKQMLEFRKSQVILVSGESGAGKLPFSKKKKTANKNTNSHIGKTETAKHILRWMTSFSGTSTLMNLGVASLEERILEASPVLEAFGNARTVIDFDFDFDLLAIRVF